MLVFLGITKVKDTAAGSSFKRFSLTIDASSFRCLKSLPKTTASNR